MLVDTTAFEWMSAAIDAGLVLIVTISCIAWATEARAAARNALPRARQLLWPDMWATDVLGSDTDKTPAVSAKAPQLNF